MKSLNSMGVEFQKLINEAIAVKAKYKKIEKKKWGLEQNFMGLVADVGELSEYIMTHKNYREIKQDVKKALGHELSDILFSIIVLADDLNIDLEQSFFNTMNEINKKIKNVK